MNRRVYSLVAMVSVLGPIPWALAAGPGSAHKANVSLLSSVEGIAPGRPFDLGVRFELEDGWHIYWQNSGDSGLPPHIAWKPPDGFRIGQLRFPVPKRHHSAGGIITNILPGAPMLIANVSAPSAIARETVTLGAKVFYLVCNDKCLREEADLSLQLPVVTNGEPKPANAKVFRRARRQLPKDTSKHLTVGTAVTPSDLAPGTNFELALEVDIKRGLHIQSNKPLTPSLIATDIFMERAPGIEFGEPIYPEPKVRRYPVLGKLSEFAGKVTVRIPGQVDASRTGGPVRIAGVLRFQACTDKGQCMPPDALAFSWSDSAKGVGNAASPNEGLAAAGRAATGEVAPLAVPQERAGEQNRDAAFAGDVDTEAIFAGANDGDLEAFLRRLGPMGLLLGCFLYCLFINATPCVMPLLSIKVLGFVQQAHESRRRTFALGLSFGVGVLLFFVVLGFLAAQGRNVLQYPVAVITLGGIVMALALSMLGVFTLQVPAAATGLEARIRREGLFASFGKGALAPVLGFACTGPLLAGAWGWATQQPPKTAILAFLFAGFGMASPYILLGANPKWLSFLPKPGNWMITFERVMGFLLLAVVIWLVHPLTTQIGTTGLEWTLAFYVALAMSCWLWGKVRITMPAARRWRYRFGATTVAAVAAVVIYGWVYPLGPAVGRARAELFVGNTGHNGANEGIAWRRWTPDAVYEAVTSGRIAFVDFTAAYCTNCKVNKRIAINTPEVVRKLNEMGVASFRGDFTLGDPDIFDALQEHGRAGVPMNLIYPAGRPDGPILLDPQLTKGYLLRKLEDAERLSSASVSARGS